MVLDIPIFCKVIPSYQPTWFQPPVPSFAFKSSARNLTILALPVSYTFPPQRHVRDFHPLERSAAKRTKDEIITISSLFLPFLSIVRMMESLENQPLLGSYTLHDN
ncbi:hypothetical protein [Neobacillus niacini]|uniref:hypothetical protein n=1 Tax=Neobacillus niacini TaxID=86668 RepID=UPI00203BDC30|nr:hypothetical protein [Neobacillus niacini]MCM3690969.1 hypothetical protein [Neobacillus niacini]